LDNELKAERGIPSTTCFSINPTLVRQAEFRLFLYVFHPTWNCFMRHPFASECFQHRFCPEYAFDDHRFIAKT